MKKIIIFFTLSLVLTLGVNAQPDFQKQADECLKVVTGGTFGKSKIIPKLDKVALAQTSIYFKTATTREVLENERGVFGQRKSGGGSVAGRITAYLETTDGELTQEDYQGLADEFYVYLVKKLNEAGISTVEWEKIVATDFYKNEGMDLDDIRKDESAMKKKGQIYTVVNANKGNSLYRFNIAGGMNTGFAFGKAKKATGFSEDLDAPVLYSHLIVDFADIWLDGDVKTSSNRQETMFYTKVSTSKKWKMDAEVGADLKITPGGISMFWNQKSQTENLNVTKDIKSEFAFASTVTEDPEKQVLKKKDNLFAKDFNMTPMVVSTTKAQYKAAAKKALENYADTFVAKMKISKKD